MADEVPLSGGRSTRGVVRVGETVRRPPGSDAELAHALLRHLESVGFAAAPRFLGIDERGREILSYIEGYVPPELGVFSEAQLEAAAHILADFHRATAGTPLAAPYEVVCHGDPSPCNFVLRDGLPVAMIDFDACFRGSRRSDLGYAAWCWLDVGNPELEPRELGRRLGAFLRACGEPRLPDGDAVAAVLDAQLRLERRCSTSAARDPHAREVAAWARRCRDWLTRRRAEVEAGLH